MINITRRARQKLERLSSTNVDMPQARLRLIDRGQGKFGLGVDMEMPSDEIVTHNGSTVLVVEQELSARLEGATIDTEGNDEGTQLIIYEKV